MRLSIAVLALFFAVPTRASLIIVRHAERKDAKDDASLLSSKGKARAKDLSRVLASTDLKAVYCTEYMRTQQTAAPTAEAKGLKPIVTTWEEASAALAPALKARPPEDDVLVVGHTDTIPGLLKGLGVKQSVDLKAEDYDNLFIVTLRKDQEPLFLRLHYGNPSR